MFYEYNQNNSGGGFKFNKRDGITHIVIIEADNPEESDNLAREIGIYFDGCSMGQDCDCCGDRWYPAGNGTKKPLIYGVSPKQYTAKSLHLWMKKGFEVCVHYKNGTKKWF